VVLARSARALDEFVAAHPGSIGLALDVTDRVAVEAAAKQVVAACGTIDMVLYCAGHYKAMRATEFDLDEALRHVQVNQVGALHVIGAVLPRLLAQRGGHLGIVSSVAGYRGLPTRWLRADEGGADQPGADALPRPAPAGDRRVGGQPRLRRDAADIAQRVHHARADEPCAGGAGDRRGLGGRRFETHFPKRFTLWLKRS
jgi:NAD(P)-dependent dehydrogenase (short-subunit alcohol dehydrogenase family)